MNYARRHLGPEGMKDCTREIFLLQYFSSQFNYFRSRGLTFSYDLFKVFFIIAHAPTINIFYWHLRYRATNAAEWPRAGGQAYKGVRARLFGVIAGLV